VDGEIPAGGVVVVAVAVPPDPVVLPLLHVPVGGGAVEAHREAALRRQMRRAHRTAAVRAGGDGGIAAVAEREESFSGGASVHAPASFLAGRVLRKIWVMTSINA